MQYRSIRSVISISVLISPSTKEAESTSPTKDMARS
jgi:hypothetical protein